MVEIGVWVIRTNLEELMMSLPAIVFKSLQYWILSLTNIADEAYFWLT